MAFGTQHTSAPGFVGNAVSSFFFNKSLQQEGLEYRFGDYVDDIRHDMRLVGSAIIRQQEHAAERYRDAVFGTTDAVRAQTTEIAGMRYEQAVHAAKVATAIEESAQVVRAGIDATQQSLLAMRSELTDQLTHVRWAIDQQSDLLRDILAVVRENRKNECRQLVQQGLQNLQHGYLPEARERLEAALVFDNTDHELHQHLGFVFVRLGDLDQALMHFQKALAFLPVVAPIFRHKRAFAVARATTHVARTHYARGEYRDAAMQFEQALQAEPGNAKNWYDLGVMCAYTADAERGARAVATAVRLQPFYYGRVFADPELNPIRAAVEGSLDDAAEATAGDLDATLDEVHASIAHLHKAVADFNLVVAPLPTPEAIDALADHDGSFVSMDAARTALLAMEQKAKAAVAKAIDPGLAALKRNREREQDDFRAAFQRKDEALERALQEARGGLFRGVFAKERIRQLEEERRQLAPSAKHDGSFEIGKRYRLRIDALRELAFQLTGRRIPASYSTR